MKRPKLSKAVLRQTQREAAEEFFRKKRRQPTQVRPLHEEQQPSIQLPKTESGLPPSGSTLDIDQSKEILRQLASGELKHQRR